MTKSILYSIAKTPSGSLVKAADAEKGGTYTCPGCEQELVLRKGLKKRPHFAHKVLSPNCTPESALHYAFKTSLFEKIQESINSQSSLGLKWDCSICGGQHGGNLLKKATSVKLEHNLGSCRPDIALLNEDDSTVAVIEVIVTHPPEQSTLDYYSREHIAVVSYELKSDEDIDRLGADILEPDNVNACRSPKCSRCGMHKSRSKRSGGYERMRVSGLQVAYFGLVEPDFCRFGVSATAETH